MRVPSENLGSVEPEEGSAKLALSQTKKNKEIIANVASQI